MRNTVIKVESVSKRYTIAHQRNWDDGLRHVIENAVRSVLSGPKRCARYEKEEFWALKNVSFEVKEGEILGIIGRNGAGKSTMLKILSRITEPTSGRIEIEGRVASLLEVGTGFHQELTGRENIYLNGAILGMSRAEIKSKFDAIVEFSEIERFLDTPVKRYSSGMYVRLAFAVAAHLEPEILIVDEVLAVGDTEFQKKCLGKMQAVSRAGRTVLFVSHSMQAVAALCTKALLLESGTVKHLGPANTIIELYSGNAREPVFVAKEPKAEERPNRILKAWIESPNNAGSGVPVSTITKGAVIELVVQVAIGPNSSSYVVASFWDEMKRPLWEFSGGDYVIPAGQQSELRIRTRLPELANAIISVDLAVGVSHSFDDYVVGALVFSVRSNGEHQGGTRTFLFAPDAEFKVRTLQG